MTRRLPLGFLAACFLSFLPAMSQAQYWHALPALKEDKGMSVTYSNDDKFVYFLSAQSGMSNVWRVSTKGGAPEQITKFTDAPVVRIFHLINKPAFVYMKAKSPSSNEYHLYLMDDKGQGEPQDISGGADGVHSELVGASYNGRYVYYTSNKAKATKEDVVRYDVQQNISQVVFPNDKDYRPLAWSRDHGRLLMEDPATGALSFFDIETTERTPAIADQGATHYTCALMDPMNKEIWTLQSANGANEEKAFNIASKQWKPVRTGAFTQTDLSINGKYTLLWSPGAISMMESATGTEVALPKEATSVVVSPKESSVLYTSPAADGVKLTLMDLAKKTSVDLCTVK